MSSPTFFTRASPLPAIYYYALAVGEPAYHLLLALYALLNPVKLYDDYLDFRWVVKLGEHGGGLRGSWAVTNVGIHTLTFALLSAFLLPTLQTNLRSQPQIHENILLTFFLSLALFDILSIFFTFSPLPSTLVSSPSKWTWTFLLVLLPRLAGLAVRSAWFVGFKRPTYGLGDGGRAKPQPYFKTPTAETARRLLD